MRLIDADELLKEVISIRDGWLRPPEEWRSIEDSIRMAPTIPYDMKWNPECEDCFPEDINDCIYCRQRKRND